MDNQEKFLYQKAKAWMSRNHKQFSTPDEMTADCVYFFEAERTYEDWLENLDHWVWDLADETFRSNKRLVSPMDEDAPELEASELE